MDPGYLTTDDPLLAHARAQASKGDRDTLAWVLGSARRWAYGEFARRMRHDDHDWLSGPERIQERVIACRRKQAAVLIGDDKREHVYVGMCGAEMSEMFVRIQTAHGFISGVFEIRDIFQLPGEWAVTPWPLDINRADTGKPDIPIRPWDQSLETVDATFNASRARLCVKCLGRPAKGCQHCGSSGYEPLPSIGALGLNERGNPVVWGGTNWMRVSYQKDNVIVCMNGMTITSQII